jgi:hypothetical protein
MILSDSGDHSLGPRWAAEYEWAIEDYCQSPYDIDIEKATDMKNRSSQFAGRKFLDLQAAAL